MPQILNCGQEVLAGVMEMTRDVESAQLVGAAGVLCVSGHPSQSGGRLSDITRC